MKKSFFAKHIFSLMMLTMFSFVFTGCGGDDDDPADSPQADQTPYASCSLATNNSVFEVGEELAATVRLDVNQSSNGAEIKQVVFYLDNMFIGQSTSSPFILNYKLSNVSVGTHTLSAAITVGGKNYSDITINKEVTITVNSPEPTEPAEPQEPEVGLYGALPSAGANGRIYHGWVWLDRNESSPGCSIKKVDYYWDDRLVTTATSIHGYAFNLQLTDYDGAEGTRHIVKAVATVGGNGYKDKEIVIERNVDIVLSNTGNLSCQLLLGKQMLIKNGENLRVYLWRCYGKDVSVHDTFMVNLYWEGNLVCTESLNAYGGVIMSYPINDVSIGTHKITIESIIYQYDPVLKEDVVDARVPGDFTITVIE